MNKTWNTVKTVLTWVLVAVAVLMMVFTVVSVATLDRKDRSIFGYKAFIVLSDSMKATDFAAGDVVIVKEVDPTTLKAGDIIAYTSQNPENYGDTVTHKIKRLTTDAKGNPGFVTYGTTTGVEDDIVVTYPYVNGQYKGRIPYIGKFFSFLKTTPGYIICILIPFLLLIVIQGLNTVKLFKKYKKEQMADLDREKAEIEEERRKSEAMMAELLALKAQMAGKTSDGEQPSGPPTAPRDESANDGQND